MQVLILTYFMLLMNVTSFADKENALMGGESMSEPAIAKVLPADYAAYEKALTGENGLSDARASLVLLSKAKECLRQPSSSRGEKQDRISAYRATWSLCLRTAQKSNDEAAQRLIIDEWNKSLKKDDDAVPSQIYSLSAQWDRKLLTDDFWQLLRQTNRRKTISAISYIFYRHGNAADVERLMEKRKSGIDVELQEIIQNAVNWMNYRLSGDTTDPGPAALPPRME